MPYRPFDLTGHVALVTGGNRGIGLGMAGALAQAGADVAIFGRDSRQNEVAAASLREHGTRIRSRVVDVGIEEQVLAAVAATVADLGRVDSVFANAGIGGPSVPFVDLTTDSYWQVLRVNLDGAFWTLRSAARHMVDRAAAGDPGGSLVGIASLAAIDGFPRHQGYAASKSAVLAMVKATAVELARYGIRANTIAPGWVATEMTAAAQQDAKVGQKVLPRIPARRWGEPADFGGLAVYLASSASAYHTGDVFVVDGGYSIF